jgi:hypothetical protein
MYLSVRKTSPAVHRGWVRRKQNWALTPGPYDLPPGAVELLQERPGRGYIHVVRRAQVREFLPLLPEWAELSRGLRAIVLASQSDWADAYYSRGVVELCAWPRELWQTWGRRHYLEHASILERLEVPAVWQGDEVELRFTETTARGFLLLHVLVHELGHHHDRMTTASRRISRGEGYAEAYAREHEAELFRRYVDRFGLPR